MKLLRFLRRRPNALVVADAEALIASFGDRAYELARTRARTARQQPKAPDRPQGHWDKVRNEIARRTGKERRLDTATRYLES